jgi:DNA-binding NarL/FixJ family response regulator
LYVGRRINVKVHAPDPVSRAGVAAELGQQSGMNLVENGEVVDVAIVAAEVVDDDAVRLVRSLQRTTCPRVLLVVTQVDDGGLYTAVEAGICGLIRRAEATPETLAKAVRSAAAGDGTVPPDLLGRLLEQIRRLQEGVLEPRGLNFTGLSDREIDVLRLVADGCDTSEIAKQLAYSERTIKNVIQGVTSRLHLRNRSHAVAYAVRQGLI